MACCVPGCVNPLQKWAAKLPHDDELRLRWKAAIQTGTGQLLPDEYDLRCEMVCDIHFPQQEEHFGENTDQYREPSLFVRNDIQFQVGCCELCLRYDTADCMFNVETCLVQNHSLQKIAKKYFGNLLPCNKQPVEDRFFCESCTVRLDMTHSLWLELTNGAKQYKKLIRKMASEKVPLISDAPVTHDLFHCKQESSESSDVPTSDHDISMEQGDKAMIAIPEDIIVKEESQLNDWDEAPKVPESSDDESQPEAKLAKSNKKRIFKCYICNILQDSRQSQIHHLMIEHKIEQTYRCEDCNVSFNKITAFNTHLARHDPSKPLKCSVCLMRFVKLSTKHHHEATQHGIDHGPLKQRPKHGKHKCLTCGKAYFYKSELKRHELVRHRGEAFTRCEICDKPFASTQNLQLHLMIHRNEKPYKCKLCNVSYRQHHYLVDHMKKRHTVDSVTKEEPIASRDGDGKRHAPKCNFCKAKFKQSKDMVAHFKEHHPETELKTFPCTDCEETFFSTKSLYSHRYIHLDTFACEQCGKRNYSNRSLAKHRLTAHNVPLSQNLFVKCPDCGQEFVQGTSYSRHVRLHKEETDKSVVGEKIPVVCTLCGMGFASNSSLTRHKKRCNGVKTKNNKPAKKTL